MNPFQEMQKKLREQLVLQVSMQHQFDALLKLYDAAAMIPTPTLTEMYRDQLHTLLDSRLDVQNTVMEFTRQLIKLSE